jgi:hypothetical protein
MDINELKDIQVDAWLAYYMGYSNIGLVNDRLYACDSITGSWQPVSFHFEEVGTDLIEKHHPTMQPQWALGAVSHWYAYIGNYDANISGEGQTHRQAAMRCILCSLHGDHSVPWYMPPQRKL